MKYIPEDIPIPLPSQPTRFLDLFRQFIRQQNKAYKTEKTYVHWVKRFIYFHNTKHPKDMGSLEIEQFLGDLAVKHNVSINTQRIALNALVFLYKQFLKIDLGQLNFQYAKAPRNIPAVFSDKEAKAIIQCLPEPYRLKAQLMYGTGLSVSECCRLRILNIDFDMKTITVRKSKGNKDSITRTMIK